MQSVYFRVVLPSSVPSFYCCPPPPISTCNERNVEEDAPSVGGKVFADSPTINFCLPRNGSIRLRLIEGGRGKWLLDSKPISVERGGETNDLDTHGNHESMTWHKNLRTSGGGW